MNRIAAIALLCLTVAFPRTSLAQAQIQIQIQIQKVAILSKIGDVITIDVYRQRTGTSIDSNVRETIKVSSPAFDHAALLAAQEAVLRLNPKAEIATLAVPAAGSDNDPSRLVMDGKLQHTSALFSALKREGFKHLLLLSKHRAPARLQLSNLSVGSGYLSGLGYYIDGALRTQRSDTGESARGFIAPYAYLKLTLIDVDLMLLVRAEEIIQSAARSAARNESGLDPWGAMTTEQKFSALQDLIVQGVTEAVPAAFGFK